MKVLQTKPQIRIMNFNFNDLYHTVNKNRDEKEIVSIEYENNEKDYNNFDDFLTPNHYIGKKHKNEVLGWRKMRSQWNHFKKFIVYK